MPEAAPRTVFEVRPAKDSLVTYENFVHVLASLKNTLKTLSGSVFSANSIPSLSKSLPSTKPSFLSSPVPKKIAPLVRSQIAAQYPDAIITHMTDYMEPWLSHNSQSIAQLSLAAPYYLPLNTIVGKAPTPWLQFSVFFLNYRPIRPALFNSVSRGAKRLGQLSSRPGFTGNSNCPRQTRGPSSKSID